MPATYSHNRHSDEIQDIIGRPPSSIVRSGMMVIACILFVILLGAWLLRYPDVIAAPVTIAAANPPVEIISKSNGRISNFYVNDGDSVNEDAIIAIIDNPANASDMMLLEKVVVQLDTALNLSTAINRITLPENLQVGEVQSNFVSLVQAINDYKFYVANKYYSNKMKNIKAQQDYNKDIIKTFNEKENMLQNQLTLEKWKDSVNGVLLKERVISHAEYNEIRKGYLTQTLSAVDNSVSKLQSRSQWKEYEKGMSDLNQEYRLEEKNVQTAIRGEAKKMRGLIATWEKQYVLRSPVSGRISFFKVRKSNQNVQVGERLFVVVREATGIEVRAQLSINKAGKIKRGQRVLIKLREYPYEEFGMLTARVTNIPDVSLDSSYTLQLILEKGLLTTRNKIIPRRPQIVGEADIITNDKNVLERVFESVYRTIY